MTESLRSRVLRECKPFIGLVVYAIVRVTIATLAGSQGVLTPSGVMDKKVAALMLATLILRLIVLFVVPLIATYRLVMRALR